MDDQSLYSYVLGNSVIGVATDPVGQYMIIVPWNYGLIDAKIMRSPQSKPNGNHAALLCDALPVKPLQTAYVYTKYD